MKPQTDQADDRAAAQAASSAAATALRPLGVASLFGDADASSDTRVDTIAEAIGDSQKHFSDLLKSLDATAKKAKEAKASDDKDTPSVSKAESKDQPASTDRLKLVLDAYTVNASDPPSSPLVKAKAA